MIFNVIYKHDITTLGVFESMRFAMFQPASKNNIFEKQLTVQ